MCVLTANHSMKSSRMTADILRFHLIHESRAGLIVVVVVVGDEDVFHAPLRTM